jgi:ATP-dependent DNA helicase RecG
LTSAQLLPWLDAPEGEHLEFKEAKTRYDFDELTKYCVALANEGGGRMVLGVTNKPSFRACGSRYLPPSPPADSITHEGTPWREP